MMTRRLRRGEEALWEEVDRAFFGEGSTREERARQLGAMLDWAADTGRLPSSCDVPSLGEAIRRGRQELGLRQKQAAERVGVPTRLWMRWEGDRELPSREDLARVSEVVGSRSELARRLRLAPRLHLARALEAPSVLRAARSAGDYEEAGVELEVRNLDPRVRAGLAAWCAAQGRDGELAAALAEARGFDPAAQEDWVRAVAALVEP